MAAILKIIVSNRLVDFDEIRIAMHINCFNPIGDQIFENRRIRDYGRRPP